MADTPRKGDNEVRRRADERGWYRGSFLKAFAPYWGGGFFIFGLTVYATVSDLINQAGEGRLTRQHNH